MIRFWLSRNFSPEVDAAVITALVTIPLGLATLLGTIWISITSNRKTVETAIMQQRTTMRDQLFSKRIDLYDTLIKESLNYRQKKIKSRLTLIENYELYVRWLYDFFIENYVYLSKDIRFLLYAFLETSLFDLGEFPDFGFREEIRNSKLVYLLMESYSKNQKVEIGFETELNTLPKQLREDIFESMREVHWGVSNVNAIDLFPSNWIKKFINKILRNPNTEKKDISLRRYIGFLYEKNEIEKEEKDILQVTDYSIYKETHRLFLAYLNYLIFCELDFYYLDKDIQHLYQSDFNA